MGINDWDAIPRPKGQSDFNNLLAILQRQEPAWLNITGKS